jgi:WD40 repeat protein
MAYSRCCKLAARPYSMVYRQTDDLNEQVIIVGFGDRSVREYHVQPRNKETKYVFSGDVSCLAISPNQKFLVSGSLNRICDVWDLASLTYIRALDVHTEQVRSMAFSRDGTLLATVSDDKLLILWDTVTWKDMHIINAHDCCVKTCSFSFDDKLLATGTCTGEIKLWRIKDPTSNAIQPSFYASLVCNSSDARSICFSPIKNLLAVLYGDGLIRIWEQTHNGFDITRVLTCGSFHTMVAFSPNGKILAASKFTGDIILWRVSDNHVWPILNILRGHSDLVSSISFHANSNHLASVSYDNTMRIWTICEWRDKVHHLFGSELKRIVFQLMCIEARQRNTLQTKNSKLPIEMWLHIFKYLSIAMTETTDF